MTAIWILIALLAFVIWWLVLPFLMLECILRIFKCK
jgi:hypothetical protein